MDESTFLRDVLAAFTDMVPSCSCRLGVCWPLWTCFWRVFGAFCAGVRVVVSERKAECGSGGDFDGVWAVCSEFTVWLFFVGFVGVVCVTLSEHSVCPSVYLSVILCHSLSFSVILCLSVSLCLPVCLDASVSFSLSLTSSLSHVVPPPCVCLSVYVAHLSAATFGVETVYGL